MGNLKPSEIKNNEYRFDCFSNGKVLLNKKKNHLPCMGWNSWNAFGSGNTQELTKAMADAIISLGLDSLGYKYIVLDDGCYKSERVNGFLSNEEVKFPDGFKALSDYVHSKGLKFGMYNDIGTNLCAGAVVGTCGHEKTDAKSYIDWGVDFLKIDNCYYLWDNATFSNPENAKYVFAPSIKSITICNQNDKNNSKKLYAVKDGKIFGKGARYCITGKTFDEKGFFKEISKEEALKNLEEAYVSAIGTFDGTNTGTTPVGIRSSELQFEIDIQNDGKYEFLVEYASSKEWWIGQWLQLAVKSADDKDSVFYFDELLPETKSKEDFQNSKPIVVELKKGKNIIRLMNHRRQENTLDSYAAMLEGLNVANPNHDVILSICEWGKTHPQNWGYKVGDSWRILNDITFRVGSDGNAGFGAWKDPGTPSVTSQYNKAVIMDEFAGLDKGWNDPDMLMIGMNGLDNIQNKTHFTLWCMMNSPLMLGLDLRKIQKDDEIYKIIANQKVIELNQDKLGIQAKRIFTTADCSGELPDKAYIENIDRVDVLVKPLADGSIALSFINVSENDKKGSFEVDVSLIKKYLSKWNDINNFYDSSKYKVEDLWSGNIFENTDGRFFVNEIKACDNITYKISPVK